MVDNAVADFGQRDFTRVVHDTDRRRLIALGRMDVLGVAQKGFEDLLYGLSALDKNTRGRLHTEIIGDGELRVHLENLARRLKLDNVTFSGRLNNPVVRERLLDADVVVLLSRFEGRSMFAIEGMLAGCAVLFTDTGGLADLATNNGWLVSVQDVSAISRALEEISNRGISELSKMGQRSRERALISFSASHVADTAYRHLRNAIEFLK